MHWPKPKICSGAAVSSSVCDSRFSVARMWSTAAGVSIVPSWSTVQGSRDAVVRGLMRESSTQTSQPCA